MRTVHVACRRLHQPGLRFGWDGEHDLADFRHVVTTPDGKGYPDGHRSCERRDGRPATPSDDEAGTRVVATGGRTAGEAGWAHPACLLCSACDPFAVSPRAPISCGREEA